MTDSAASRQPNLLYIHSDQHSPFVLGCAGDPTRPDASSRRTGGSWRPMHKRLLSISRLRAFSNVHAHRALSVGQRGLDQQPDA